MNKSHALPFTFATMYASFVVLLSVTGFAYDVGNYIEHISAADSRALRILMRGILPTLFNEPVWLIITNLARVTAPPEVSLLALRFFSAFLIAYTAASVSPNKSSIVFMAIVLLSPFVLTNYIGQLRQGVAVAIFSFGYFSKNKKAKFFSISITPFIHSSFFPVVALLGATKLLKKTNAAPDLRVAIIFTFLATIVLLIPSLAHIIGLRQAGSGVLTALGDVSGVGFLFWSAFLFLFLLNGRQFTRANLDSIGVLFLHLAAYSLLETQRLLENGLLLIVVTILSLPPPKRIIAIMLFSVFSGLTWTVH